MDGIQVKIRHGELKVCQFCGLTFKPLMPSQTYCTNQCAILHSQGFKPIADKICPVCHQAFYSPHKARIYCSDACYREARNIAKGWKQTKQQWQNLREFILERDNFTCQDCGKFSMGKGLEVHHIKPLHLGGTNNESNLITLCHRCHKRRHMKGIINPQGDTLIQ